MSAVFWSAIAFDVAYKRSKGSEQAPKSRLEATHRVRYRYPVPTDVSEVFEVRLLQLCTGSSK